MKPLRALVLTPDFPPAPGGIQLLVHRLVSHFNDVRCRVLTLHSPGAAAWDGDSGIDVRRVSTRPDRRAGILRLNASALLEARRFRPHVILLMHIIVAPAAAVIAETRDIPILTYLYAREIPARPKVASLAVRKSDRVVAISRYAADLGVAAGAPSDRIRIIPPGVDWHERPPAPRLATPTVVTVARLEDRYKGHDVMTRAMPLIRSRVPEAQWLVIGDGSLRRDIERLARAQGIGDAIRLCGSVSDAERDRWLDCAHVFAMPSRLPPNGGAGEGFGIAYLEAGVHGLPVVAGNVGGALDAVIDGTTGLLVDPTDHVQVADAISRLLLDQRQAARMGDAGSEHARSFTWPEIAGRVEDLIAETVRRT
jgi:phosphatidyl-myo-inositol dimannoside synthase